MRRCLYLLCYILVFLYPENEGYAQVGIETSDARQLSLENMQLKNKKLDDLCTLDYRLMSRPEYMTLLKPGVDKTNTDKVLPCEIDSLLQKISHIFDEWEESIDIGSIGSWILPTTVFNPNDNVAINARSLRGQVRQVFRLVGKCITIAHISENRSMEFKFYRHYIKYMNSLKNTDEISYHMKWAAIENLLIIADTHYDSYSKTEKEDILIQLKKMKNILTLSLIEVIINERSYLVRKLYNLEYCEDAESINNIWRYVCFLSSLNTENNIIKSALMISEDSISQTIGHLKKNNNIDEPQSCSLRWIVSDDRITDGINMVNLLIHNYLAHVKAIESRIVRYSCSCPTLGHGIDPKK